MARLSISNHCRFGRPGLTQRSYDTQASPF